MSQAPTDFLVQLQTLLGQKGVRVALVLEGRAHWRAQALAQIGEQWGEGASLSESDAPQAFLGQELNWAHLAFQRVPPANLMGAVSGAIKAGGLLVLEPLEVVSVEHRTPYFYWWMQAFREASLVGWHEAKGFSKFDFLQALPDVEPPCAWRLTASQRTAHTALDSLVTGHRNRPLVLLGARGRGKSALLGEYLAKQVNGTAPKQALVVANESSQWAVLQARLEEKVKAAKRDSFVRFRDRQALSQGAWPEAQWVIVEEAASLPVDLLLEIAGRYSRVVFATTTLGYEGTGRGFSLRFLPQLRRISEQVHQVELTEPVRYAQADPLEALIYKALILNAQSTALHYQPEAKGQMIQTTADKLVKEHAQWLEQLMALMIQSHYRTRPSDLQHWLEDPQVKFLLAVQDQQLLGACLVVDEKTLPAELIEPVMRGERRAPGHLTAQSLLTETRLSKIASLKIWRVLRIAVSAEIFRQGIGRAMLFQLRQVAAKQGVDLLSASFGLEAGVLQFWQAQGFHLAKLGHKAERISGEVSALVLSPLSQSARVLAEAAHQAYSDKIWVQLRWARLPLKTSLLMALLPRSEAHMDAAQLAQLAAFARNETTFEALYPLWDTWTRHGQSLRYLPEPLQAFLLSFAYGHLPMERVLAEGGWSSKKEAVRDLRSAVQARFGE